MNPRAPALDPSLLKTALLAFLIVGVIGIGLGIIARVRRSMAEPEGRPADLLTSLQEAYEAGEMDEEEFRRVRETLRKKADGAGPRVERF